MLWVKAFHVIFMVCWFAGIFYLPRLFVYHAQSKDSTSNERFKIMERKLYFGIMTPSAVLTIVFGVWLIAYNWTYYLHAGWLHLKLIFVFLLVIFHLYCNKWRRDFYYDRNSHSDKFYRLVNELPVLALITIVILVIVKPF